jgi:hypothetical protein
MLLVGGLPGAVVGTDTSWKIDIPRTVEDVTGHKIVLTHGHL